MKSLLVPELAHEMIFDFMKEHGVEIYSIRYDPDEFEKYHKYITEILLHGVHAMLEIEHCNELSKEVSK